MGLAVADYDNDGFEDVFVTAYGSVRLYHGTGNCNFVDVTEGRRPGAAASVGRYLVHLFYLGGP